MSNKLIKKQQEAKIVALIAEAFDGIEDGLDELITIMAFVMLTEPQDVLEWFRADMDQRFANYKRAMTIGGDVLATNRHYTETYKVLKRYSDIRNSLDSAIAGDHELLRAALMENMDIKAAQRFQAIERNRAQRERAAQRQAEAQRQAVAQSALDNERAARTARLQNQTKVDITDRCKQTLVDYRLDNLGITSTDLVERYLKLTDPNSDVYQHIQTSWQKSHKTILNWGI